MKTLKILGSIVLMLIGVAMIFTGSIMVDLDTPYTLTTIMIIMLGLIVCGAGVTCLIQVGMEDN